MTIQYITLHRIINHAQGKPPEEYAGCDPVESLALAIVDAEQNERHDVASRWEAECIISYDPERGFPRTVFNRADLRKVLDLRAEDRNALEIIAAE